MKIGELAAQTNCAVETIRYYEKLNLLQAAERNSDNNYRIYNNNHLKRLLFIRHCRSLDMTLDEIRALIEARTKASGNCKEVNELIDSHLGHVKQRIAELKELERKLKGLRAQCQDPSSTNDCGILRELDNNATQAVEQDVLNHSHLSGVHKH